MSNIKPYRPVFDPEWGERFERELNDYMEALENAVSEEDFSDVETLSGEPYCGCPDCWTREYLLKAVALTLVGVEMAQIRLDGFAYQIDHEAQRQMAQHGLAKNEVYRLLAVHNYNSHTGKCFVCEVDEPTAYRTAVVYDA